MIFKWLEFLTNLTILVFMIITVTEHRTISSLSLADEEKDKLNLLMGICIVIQYFHCGYNVLFTNIRWLMTRCRSLSYQFPQSFLLFEPLFRDFWVDRLIDRNNKFNMKFAIKWLFIIIFNGLNIMVHNQAHKDTQEGYPSLDRAILLSWLICL